MSVDSAQFERAGTGKRRPGSRPRVGAFEHLLQRYDRKPPRIGHNVPKYRRFQRRSSRNDQAAAEARPCRVRAGALQTVEQVPQLARRWTVFRDAETRIHFSTPLPNNCAQLEYLRRTRLLCRSARRMLFERLHYRFYWCLYLAARSGPYPGTCPRQYSSDR